MFKLHAEDIINVSMTISRNAFCRARILESDEIEVAVIDLPIVRVRHQELPTVAMDAVPGTPFPLLPLLLFSPSVGPVFDPPGVALSLTLPGFEGSIPSFGDAGRGGSEFPEVLAIAARPSVRCW